MDLENLKQVDKVIENLKKILTNDLTYDNKKSILQLSAIQMSRILAIYADACNNKKDYVNKKVFFADGTVATMQEYNDFMRLMIKVKLDIGDIQRTILGEEEYNRLVYCV